MSSGIDCTNLIHAAQTGDPVALGRLLAVCQADVRRYAYRHCHASDVDDAVQESLLVISRKVKGLKAAAAFSSLAVHHHQAGMQQAGADDVQARSTR